MIGEREFNLGEILILTEAERSLMLEDIMAALMRHASGDWGEVDDDQKAYNDEPVKTGFGCDMSSEYLDRNGKRFCVHTVWEPRSTRVSLP